MKKLNLLCLLLLSFCFLTIKCDCSNENNDTSNETSSTSSSSTSSEPSSNSNNGNNDLTAGIKDLQDAMKEGQDALKQLQGDNANIKPANFRKIKEITPDELLGMKRKKIKGSSGGFGGYNVSTVESEFSAGDKRLKVKTIDMGGIGKSAFGVGYAAWATVEIDEEGEDYFKRTSTMGDFKTFEECNTTRKRCELKLYSKEGIVGELDGRNVSIDDLRKAAGELGLEKIAGMREKVE